MCSFIWKRGKKSKNGKCAVVDHRPLCSLDLCECLFESLVLPRLKRKSFVFFFVSDWLPGVILVDKEVCLLCKKQKKSNVFPVEKQRIKGNPGKGKTLLKNLMPTSVQLLHHSSTRRKTEEEESFCETQQKFPKCKQFFSWYSRCVVCCNKTNTNRELFFLFFASLFCTDTLNHTFITVRANNW